MVPLNSGFSFIGGASCFTSSHEVELWDRITLGAESSRINCSSAPVIVAYLIWRHEVTIDKEQKLEYFTSQKFADMKSSSVVMAAVLLLYQTPLHKCFNFMRVMSNSRFSTSLQLNRIFCDMEELIESDVGPDLRQSLVLKINESDIRCKHIKTILKLNVGDTIKGSTWFISCILSFMPC